MVISWLHKTQVYFKRKMKDTRNVWPWIGPLGVEVEKYYIYFLAAFLAAAFLGLGLLGASDDSWHKG